MSDLHTQIGAIGVISPEPFEACGSPGEVLNQPQLGHRFTAQLTGTESGQEELFASYEPSNGKRMVHTMIALYAEDQLRQRVAWALSQIFVIGESGLSDHTEVASKMTQSETAPSVALDSL